MSTLRYADRAKRIMNHAVVNEDPNAKVSQLQCAQHKTGSQEALTGSQEALTGSWEALTGSQEALTGSQEALTGS